MKRIIIEKGSKGEALLKMLKESKIESEKKMKARFPSEELYKEMWQKTLEVDKLNKGTLDKSTFMLGMMSMYFLLKKKENES